MLAGLLLGLRNELGEVDGGPLVDHSGAGQSLLDGSAMLTILPDSAMFWLTIRRSVRLLRSALYESPAARCRIARASARGVPTAGAEQFIDLSGNSRQ
jgi:hypothetical protein